MEAREGGPSPKTDLKEVSFIFVIRLVAAHLSVYDGHCRTCPVRLIFWTLKYFNFKY